MRDTELNDRKAEALYCAYKQGLEQGKFASLFGAGRSVALSPAPSFFISAKRASLLLGRIDSHISLINMHAPNRRMAWRLWHDYHQYLAEHPGNTLSRERILETLVEEPAPEFYISADAARRILRKCILKARRKMGW